MLKRGAARAASGHETAAPNACKCGVEIGIGGDIQKFDLPSGGRRGGQRLAGC
jgi:hypothetical protein